MRCRPICGSKFAPAMVCGCAVLIGNILLTAQVDAAGQTRPTTVSNVSHSPNSTEDIMNQAVALFQSGSADAGIKMVDDLREAGTRDHRVPILLLRLNNLRADELASIDRNQASKYMLRAAELTREFATGHFVEVMEPGSQPSPQQVASIKAALATNLVREAGCHARNNDNHQALNSLAEAFQWGYQDIDSIVNSNDDFSQLADQQSFKRFVDGQRVKIGRRIVKETRKELAEFVGFDFNFELPDLNGLSIRMSQFKGKVLIVDLWGTWCPPCRAEVPSFIRLKEIYGAQGLEVVGLTYERAESTAANFANVQNFVNEFKVNYPCLMGDQLTKDQIPNFHSYPTTLFIDSKGTVRLQLSGLHSYIKLESIVKELLAEQSGQQMLGLWSYQLVN